MGYKKSRRDRVYELEHKAEKRLLELTSGDKKLERLFTQMRNEGYLATPTIQVEEAREKLFKLKKKDRRFLKALGVDS